LLHRRFEAPLVLDAGPFACVEQSLRAGGGQRQRLLAKHLLPGCDCFQHLRLVLAVRRRDDHRLDGAVRKNLVQRRGELSAVLARKVGDGGQRHIYGVRDADVPAISQAGRDLLSPPAESHDRNLQHTQNSLPIRASSENAHQRVERERAATFANTTNAATAQNSEYSIPRRFQNQPSR
jgi:hypothetical protein